MTGTQGKFTEEELLFFKTKHQKNRLYFALQFQYYRLHKLFFENIEILSQKNIYKVAKYLTVSPKLHPIPSKTKTSYLKEIREYFQSRASKAGDEDLVKKFLTDTVFPKEAFNAEQLKERIFEFLLNKIEPFSEKRLARVIKSAVHQYEEKVFEFIASELDFKTKAYLDGLLIVDETSTSRLSEMKQWAGGLSLKTILYQAEKLKFFKLMDLPQYLRQVPEKVLQRHYRNICSKYPSAIKEMPETHRYALLAIFSFIKNRQITDTLTDLLIRLTKKIFTTSKNRIKKDLSNVVQIKSSCSNKTLLKTLVATILRHEDQVIKRAIYPVVSKENLEAFDQKNRNGELSYDELLHVRARNSYLYHYRRMLVPVLELLEFRTNNDGHQSILKALDLIKPELKSGCLYYSEQLNVPIEGAIKKSDRSFVLESTEYGKQVNRVNYELYVLKNLKNKLRVKEIWVENAYQFRNPEEDLPQDFDANKSYYYNLLKKPKKASYFIRHLKREMNQCLARLNTELPNNAKVKILKKPLGYIKVSKLKEQAPPIQLEKIKQEIFERWSHISLLDVLKETDLFVNFLQAFTPSGPKEGLDPETLKKRLLLVILGYGTNTGLKSVSSGNDETTYQDLKHVKLRYLDPDNLRDAIRQVVNQLLEIRSPTIWEACTTAVASDSKHFTASDQNLMSQWHPRYHSKGVMIYWHVDTKAMCIYSQLKNCCSSEVSAMIEGVLRHCTDMSVKKNYVDTHGASEVGFAFSYLLDFDLLPRFKSIHTQKLYVVEKDDLSHYEHLSYILARPINWRLIEEQYDQIIKYTAALKLGTANAEAIMKRFTQGNLQHPTYKALSELGKAVKTIFLCRYLGSEDLRQEIHEGLNVVERWNGVNDFIFYGKAGAFRNNKPEELELSMLCLHLLQLSLTYINTLMLEQVIKESDWLSQMTTQDKRAITPLLHEHINPYGTFILDLEKRLALNHPHLKEAA